MRDAAGPVGDGLDLHLTPDEARSRPERQLEGHRSPLPEPHPLDVVELDRSIQSHGVQVEGQDSAIPLLFPVFLGDAPKPYDADSVSGLAFGYSNHMATFRGPYEGHSIHIDGILHKIRLDDGPEQEWTEEDDDYELTAPDGTALFLDLTNVPTGFVGDVKVGVMGRPRRVLWKEILIQ